MDRDVKKGKTQSEGVYTLDQLKDLVNEKPDLFSGFDNSDSVLVVDNSTDKSNSRTHS